MSITTKIKITHGSESLQTVKDLVQKQASKPRTALVALGRFFESVCIGNRSAKVEVAVGTTGVKASGTITLASFVADDTVTICGTVLTGKASPSTTSQFACGGTNTADAAALAACINAHANFIGVCTATSSLAVVTITCVESGLIGNLGTLAISAHGSRSGANFTGGTNDAVSYTTYHAGV